MGCRVEADDYTMYLKPLHLSLHDLFRYLLAMLNFRPF